MTTPKEPSADPEKSICPVHQEPAKWHCGHCGAPLCKSCKPIALHYQVFHRECVEKARDQIEEQAQAKDEIDAPSWGVKAISWSIFALGVIFFGLALFLGGLALFGKSIPIRSLMTSTVPASLDAIPGSRNILNWTGILAGLAGIGAVGIGIGLLNCVRAARYILLTVCWLEVVVALLGWMAVLLLGGGFWDIPVFALFLIWFFMRKPVRRQFEKVL
ncbi:B-box zinc finger protein [bacterium]|nr:B-box zinc finger protein [bacterium]